MNSLVATKNWLQTKGIEYDLLPLEVRKSNSQKISCVVEKSVFTVIKLTVIGAIALFIIKFLTHILIRNASQFLTVDNKTVTPLGGQRLGETEKKVHAIARKAGLPNANELKLLLNKTGEQPALVGLSTLVLPPEYVVKPEDLPEELNLIHLDNLELTEEEWIIKFDDWLHKNIVKGEVRFKSQFEVDSFIERGKAFLRIFRDQKVYDKTFEALIGHEIGHYAKHHTIIGAIVDLGWDLIALPTLGISTFFNDKVLSIFYKKIEKEADLYSKSKFGSEGLIRYLHENVQLGKYLHSKYPHKYDEHGEDRLDLNHPPLGERIKYLK